MTQQAAGGQASTSSPAAAHRTAPPATGKNKRGRESAGDMIRSLSLVLGLVVVIWFLAQPPDSDEQVIREVNPRPDITAFQRQAPGALVPLAPPPGWRSTVSTLAGDPVLLRVGYVLPGADAYAEYAGLQGGGDKEVAELTGATAADGAVQIDGLRWDRYRDEDGSLSLVRRDGGVTVVVGTTRSSASQEQLRQLVDALGTSG